MVQEKGIFSLGSICAVTAGVLVALTLPLIPLIIPSLAPSSALAGLKALESQGTIYGATWVLYLVSDLLYLVTFFALYYALRKTRRGIVVIAVALNTAFVVLDVALDIPLRLWLIALSQSYSTAGIAAQQELLSSANFSIQVSNEVALVATLFQFSALILVSYLMTKLPFFGPRVGYLGVTTGAVALLFIPAFIAGTQLAGLFNLAGFGLLAIWSVAVGIKLRKLSFREPEKLEHRLQ